MSSDVTANSRTVVHKGDGIVNVSALPDVCKTPMPAGPTPVPYPNVARDADLADGAKHVTIEGNPVALESSKLKQSSGDEAGTLGGVVSGKNRGKMTWGTSSPDVLVEGKGVIRFADLTHHNCNSYNVIKVQGGQPYVVVVYGDDGRCPICHEEAPPHPTLDDRRTVKSAGELMDTFSDPAAAGGGIVPARDRSMLAICICECGKQFAAMSTSESTPKPMQTFHAKANQMGYITMPNSGVMPQVSARLTKMCGPRAPQVLHTIRPDPTRKHANPIGNCAGPRVLCLAMEMGHRPVSLCEIWTKGNKDVTNPGPIRTYNSFFSWKRGKKSKSSPQKVVSTKRQQAPSCDTCARQIPALLCGMPEKCS